MQVMLLTIILKEQEMLEHAITNSYIYLQYSDAEFILNKLMNK